MSRMTSPRAGPRAATALRTNRRARVSGSYVARELFGQVFDGTHDPEHELANKVVYVAFVWAEDTKLSQGRSANGAKWCLHDLLITTRPHDAARALESGLH
jgi:hypothetical protein